MTTALGTERADLPVDLRVNYESSPIAVPPADPRFSWRVDTQQRGAGQTAYQIQVARSAAALADDNATVWDSGRVESPNSTDIAYGGPDLSANADYWWRVRIWDDDDDPSPWSEISTFSTALTSPRHWDGKWIGHTDSVGETNGYRSQWHPCDTDVEEWVQVDLGQVHTIDEIELYPTDPFNGPTTPDGMTVSAIYSNDDGEHSLQADGAAGFGFPVGFRIEVADEPTFANPDLVFERTDQENPGLHSLTVDVDASARFVRVTASDLYEYDPSDPPHEAFNQLKTDLVREERRTWQTFALAALAVKNQSGEDVAVEQPVETSSSIESATWGRDHLTNGMYSPQTAHGSPLLRTEVDLEHEVKRARAFVCGLGYGELYVNGQRIGTEVLNPSWTQYDERATYSTYDIATELNPGQNAIGLWLGRGWFSRNARDWTGFGGPRGIVQIEIEYIDGTTRSIASDGSWRATASPIVENDIYDGEVYDARLEEAEWAHPGYDDSQWASATVLEEPGGDLLPQQTPPIRVTQTIDPVEVLEHDDGPIIDFGQNIVGWVELTIQAPTKGDEIELHHAEVLLDDGSLNRIDLRSADASDTYIAKGEPLETYEPRFTYHGFRFVQVTGYPGHLDLSNIRAKVVHTDVDPIGTFDCSNDDLSQVQENAEWGLRGNIHGVITDCPQRDERFGWTGDNHIAARALCYNFDSAIFFEKWMGDHEDIRSDHGYIADTIPYGYGTIPEDRTWGITQVTIPWHLYRQYGDISVLERHYEGMRRYINFWQSESDDGYLSDEYGNYGDWLAFENNDGRRGLPLDLYNTAFHYHTTNLFATIADVLDRTGDAQQYGAIAEQIKKTFTAKFFDDDAGCYGPGTQSSYAVPLFVGLVPPENVDRVAENLAEKVLDDGGKLQTGFLGTRPLIHTLVDHGYEEVAYEIVSQPERPGWVYMVRQGATTTWERWDSDERIGDGMNSFNHSPFNFVSEWFYYALAGIRFDDSMHGVGSVEIAPAIVDDLEWAEGRVETVNGLLTARWERTPDGLSLEVDIPWNTEAQIRIPAQTEDTIMEGQEILWDGSTETLSDGIYQLSVDDDSIVVKVGTGQYEFLISD